MGAKACKTLWTDGTKHQASVYMDLVSCGIEMFIIRVGPKGRPEWQDLANQVRAAFHQARVANVDPWRIITVLGNEPNIEGPFTIQAYLNLYAQVFGELGPEFDPPWAAGPSLGVVTGKAFLMDMLRGVEWGVNYHVYSEPFPPIPPLSPWGIGECGLAVRDQNLRDSYWKRIHLYADTAIYLCPFQLGEAGISNGDWDERYLLTDADADTLKSLQK